MKRVRRLVRPSSLLLLATIALLAGWLFLLRPTFLGGPAGYVMVSGGSMEPTLHSGDLVLTRSRSSYDDGDIVAFRAPSGMVIHRIVGGNASEGYIMQGDNKQRPDPWRPTPDEIRGELWLSLPGAGRWLDVIRQPIILGALSAGFAVFMVMSYGEERRRAVAAVQAPLRAVTVRRVRSVARPFLTRSRPASPRPQPNAPTLHLAPAAALEARLSRPPAWLDPPIETPPASRRGPPRRQPRSLLPAGLLVLGGILAALFFAGRR